MTDQQPIPIIALTKAQAIALYDSGFWEEMTPRQIAEFQMTQDLLCIPFHVYHGAVEETLGRPVWTHEFGTEGRKQLLAELFDGAPWPTFDQILDIIPAEKRIVLVVS